MGHTMKRKSLVLALLALAGLASHVTDADAFFCCRPWRHRCHRYATQITCRPYNAFTPICWGNLVCDGCCPNPCGVASGCMPMSMGMPSCCGMGYGMSGFGGCCAGDACGATDMKSAPAICSQPFTPPMPMPSGPGTTMYQQPMPQGVSQANYYPQPMYAPQYYPGYYPMY